MLARIEAGSIVETRDLVLDAIPIHKRDYWLPVEGDEPAYAPALETIVGPALTVEPTRVLRTWIVARRPPEEQKAAVKAEARRRILARIPDWKQANITARDAELARIQAGLMIDDLGQPIAARALTTGEMDELLAIKAAWDWIKAVRAASDAIEALDPIPADFDADARWPA